MEQHFWQTRWDEGSIGFHQSEVNPHLVEHLQLALSRLKFPARPQVLVPLCGKTLDLTWLEERGCRVIGVEFVEQAVRDYFAERGLSPETIESPGLRGFEHGNVRLLIGDFFKVPADAFGETQLIYDRAALVAITPARRQEYVAHLARLLRPGGQLLIITFVHDMGSGPPFSVPDTEGLLEPYFDLELLSDQDILESESRFRARGATQLRERVFLGRRLG